MTLVLEKLAHEPDSSGFVPFRLDEQAQDLAFTIDRSPQPKPPPADHHDHPGHRRPILVEHDALVRSLINAKPDITLVEMQTELARQGRLLVEIPAPGTLPF